jgi:hypothetical protein
VYVEVQRAAANEPEPRPREFDDQRNPATEEQRRGGYLALPKAPFGVPRQL